MPRSPRIEYPNAYYHVRNRGAASNEIFYNDKSYEIFLDILAEACEKFEIVIHAYCLMNNHYHLLLQTPKANLSKFMQHVNSVYTQKFNKFMQKDGPLFRGRFKSKIVDKDSYLLGLSRYIHRNPIDFVKNLRMYKWSSYPAYLRLVECPKWLNKEETLKMLAMENNEDAYEYFVVGHNESEGSDPLESDPLNKTR